MYIDTRLFDTPKDKITYFKNMLLTGALASTVTYLINGGDLFSSLSQVGGGGGAAVSSTSVVTGIGETIMTGQPPF